MDSVIAHLCKPMMYIEDAPLEKGKRTHGIADIFSYFVGCLPVQTFKTGLTHIRLIELILYYSTVISI